MYPFIDIFGRQISTYGLCMVTAVILVTYLVIRKCKPKNIPWENIIVIAATATGIGLLGGNILYIAVTYPLSDIIGYIKNFDFSFIQKGGLVFYGALFGGILGAFLGGYISKTKIADIENIVVPYIPLGHAIGRIGCLFAGCCYGFLYNGPLAIRYSHSIFGLSAHNTYFPVQILEAVLDLLIMVYLLKYTKKPRKKYDALFTYLLLYAILRSFTELFRGDVIRGVYNGLSTGQWISISIFLIYFIRLAINKCINKK